MSNKWKGKKNCLGETGIHGGRPSLAPWISGSCQLAMVSEFCPRVTGREWRWGWQFLIRLQQSACSLYLLTSLNKSLLGCNSDESSTGELSRESTECILCATDNTCFMHFFFFWLHCIFVPMPGLSQVAASGLLSAVACLVVAPRL